MTDTIIVAVISFAGIVASGLISVIASSALVNWRLKTIEAKLETHNGYAEKFASTTTEIRLMQQDIAYIKEQLKEYGKRDKGNN